MKALILLAAVSGGCATTWLATQATGTQGAWDEHVREEAVPLPGVIEHLTIELPLTVEHDQITEPGVNGASATTHDGAARPFAMRCAIEQSAKNAVYHSAFRYGSRWGKQTAIAFVVESALAAVLLGTATAAKPNGYFYGGCFALDAVLTGAIFFIPRKEIFRQDDVAVTTPIRSDCPDGLALDIGGQPYPIDAIGKLGEVGDQALDEWMAAPQGPLLVQFDGKSVGFEIGANEQCAWLRARDPRSTCQFTRAERTTSASFTLAAGTLAVP